MTAPRRPLFFDLETKDAAVNIKGNPSRAYAENCRLDRVAWALGDDPVQVSDNVAGLAAAISEADALVAHNIAFDLSVLLYTPLPDDDDTRQLRQWLHNEVLTATGWVAPICSMGMARLLGLPAALGNLVKYLNVGVKADYDFVAAQREARDLFETPARRQERENKLVEYARNDVEVLRAAYKIMARRISGISFKTLAVHQRINCRGVQLDRDKLELLIQPLEQKGRDAERAFIKLTNFAPSKVMAFRTWLQRNGHPDLESVDQHALADIADTTVNEDVRRAIQLRQQFTGGDAAKLNTLRHWCDGDGRIRQAFTFAAASTGRWSSHGAQLQNLRRDGAARQCIVAPAGCKLWCADYHGIELRASLWLAGHQDALVDMHQGGDPYMRIAREVYGSGAGKGERYKCKMALLAAQFGAGAPRIQAVLKVSESDAVNIRDGIHTTYSGYRPLWDDLTGAVVKAFTSDRSRHEAAGGKVAFERVGGTLLMHLPTGRAVAYRGAKLLDDDTGLFTYTAAWDKTFKPQRRVVKHGGFMLENLAQSMCRDLLADALVRVDTVHGVSLVGHVHDSVYVEVPAARVSDKTAADLLAAFVPGKHQLPPGMLVGAEWHWSESWSE